MIVAIITLSFALIVQSFLHAKERQDLYNRIMSQDLGEYRTMRDPKTKLTLRANYFQKSMRQAYRTMYGQDKTE